MDAFSHHKRLYALYKLGRYDEAIECYDIAIEVEPMLVRAWYNKKLALEVQLQKAQKRLTLAHVRAKEGKGTSRKGDGSLRSRTDRSR